MPEGQEADNFCIQPNSAHSNMLVVVRGNSGSGKSTAAETVRRRFGRGCALVEQDYVRRVLLREHRDAEGAIAPAFLTMIAREALGRGYHVVLEGILDAAGHGAALRELIAGHDGPSAVFYLDVSFAETVRRHRGRAEATGFTERHMRDSYRPRDLLGAPGEHVIPETAGPDDVVATIMHAGGLDRVGPLTPCPVRCPRCADKRGQAAS
jgi:predicted kinase